MSLPEIDYQTLEKALDLAQEFLIPYQHELEIQNQELDRSEKELISAQSLFDLFNRTEKRHKALENNSSYLSFYCAALTVGDTSQHDNLISLLKYRIDAFTKKISRLNEAIALLSEDISDIQKILQTRLQTNNLTYFAVISMEPGWAIRMHTPKNWISKWANS